MQKYKKIILIAPATQFGAYPPNGLLSIAAFLRGKGLEIAVKDYSGEEINEKKVKEDLEKFNPDLVGIGVLTGPGIPRAIIVGKVAKELGKYVIWGGPHPTILPNLTLKHPTVDAVIIGEAENSFYDFINYLNGDIKEPYGCGFKDKNGGIHIMPPAKAFVNLNELPMPAWDLLGNIDKYFPYKKHNSVLISASRGCIYRCGFCHNANKDVNDYQGPYKNLDAGRVLKEFDFVTSLTKKHIDRMDIGGDLHFPTASYARKFSEDMIKNGRNIKWNSASTFYCMSEELADLIAKAGCESIMFGVESGSPRIQRLLGKPINLDLAIKVTKKLRENGVMVRCTYMMGHPTETLEEIGMTLDYMKKIPADENLLQVYRPFPGTPYYELCVKQGKFKAPEKLEDCATFGVLGYEVNMSDVPTQTLRKMFYKENFFLQLSYLINFQKFLLKNKMYEQFFESFVQNRFTFKLKELLTIKGYQKA